MLGDGLFDWQWPLSQHPGLLEQRIVSQTASLPSTKHPRHGEEAMEWLFFIEVEILNIQPQPQQS